MTNKFFMALVLVLIFPVFAFAKDSPEWVADLNIAQETGQLAIVRGIKGSDAEFSFHVKDFDGKWSEIISCPAFIGKNGWGKTREGDMKTPKGVFHFTMAFGIKDFYGCKIGYTKVDDTNYWVGDSNSEYYNQFVSTSYYNDFNKKDSEHIIDYNPGYQYCLNISYNEDGVPRLGSAIFLHCYTKNKFTGGCVAIPEDKMAEVLENVRDDCIIIMDTDKNIRNY